MWGGMPGTKRRRAFASYPLWAGFAVLLVASCKEGPTQPLRVPETLMPRPVTQLVITTQPSSRVQSGVAFSTQPVVQLRDASGNDLGYSGVVITASIASGGSVLGGTLTVRTNRSGQAVFTDLRVKGLPRPAITLGFTSGKLTVTSNSISIVS